MHFRKIQNNLKHEFGTIMSREELEDIFRQEGGVRDPKNDKVVLSGALGITCCVLEVAFAHLGNNNAMVFDGSHQEWQDKSELRIDGEWMQFANKVDPKDK